MYETKSNSASPNDTWLLIPYSAVLGNLWNPGSRVSLANSITLATARSTRLSLESLGRLSGEKAKLKKGELLARMYQEGSKWLASDMKTT